MVTMKKVTVVVMVTVVALFVSVARAGVSVVMNSSFEHDGYINDIDEEPPYHWCDVNTPSDKFQGRISDAGDWKTHGDHYLVLYSYSYVVLNAGDEATASQQVYLTDVNEIIFDVNLETGHAGDAWHTSRRTAFLKIDEDVVWDSNGLEGAPDDIRGEYLDRVYVVAEKYKDANSHTLSLGLRVNQDDWLGTISYVTKWDLVRFDTHCGGFGYLSQDFARDCYIDELDLAVLAKQWLEDVNEVYDLFKDGVFNFNDYDLFAQFWMANSDSNNWRDDNCYQGLLLDGDLNDDGIVNFVDFAILTDDWMEEVEIKDCIRGDINRSEMVDYDDILILLEEWLKKSWLYGL
jgi:hypothetical protein